jgi:hypothetical protein
MDEGDIGRVSRLWEKSGIVGDPGREELGYSNEEQLDESDEHS